MSRFKSAIKLCIILSFTFMHALSIPAPVIGRGRSVSIHFIDLTAASAGRRDLLFLLVKHGNGATAPRRAYDKLFPGETRRHFQSSAIRVVWRNKVCMLSRNANSLFPREILLYRGKRFPAIQFRITLEKSISTYCTFDPKSVES